MTEAPALRKLVPPQARTGSKQKSAPILTALALRTPRRVSITGPAVRPLAQAMRERRGLPPCRARSFDDRNAQQTLSGIPPARGPGGSADGVATVT